jgi:phosphatidylserine/phosphatidylglycerophosphate/cardiolipin synthase-like enzyme
MAARAGQGVDPWDTPCEVTPVIGGFAAMTAIRQAFKDAIDDAKASAQAPGQRGHVYISGWRLNAQRDLSDNVRAWRKPYPDVPEDETALGMLFRLMQAGVRIRVMVWLPTFIQAEGAGHAHIEDHYFSARAIAAESARLDAQWSLTDPIGIMALDARTAEGSVAGSHHQKAIVIRGLAGRDVAFCGGVDLAFTRRDAPEAAPVTGLAGTPRAGYNAGDWQSGTGIPPWPDPDDPADIPWPRDAGVTLYTSFSGLETPTHVQAPDLPATEKEDGTGKDVYGAFNQLWHDQHLILKGPIVRTLEDQFAERWSDSANLYDLSDPGNTFGGQVIFSSAKAISGGDIVALPGSQSAAAAPAGSTAAVQMWRTIPWRDARTRPPFERAEFTVMAGVSYAVSKAEHLIWIFDQYFWSVQLARQLNAQLEANSDLRVIVILPPFADTKPAIIHEARKRALGELTAGVRGKVAVYYLWDRRGSGRGVYVHAKVQTYDGGLLVCGSANMNRRSFLCDSEIACAVADEPTVASHQQALWNLLFNEVPGTLGQWPAPDFTAAGSGQLFFTAFTAAAANGNSGLRPDQWESDPPTLVNTAVLPRGSLFAGPAISHLFDPTSVDPRPLERNVDFRDAQGQLQSRPARLDDVVTRIEKTVSKGGGKRMPNRRQSSELRDIFSEPADFQDFAL